MKGPLGRLTLAGALALALCGPKTASAHGGHDRSKDIVLGHRVELSAGAVEVVQFQEYSGVMVQTFFTELDADGDGRLSAQEREAGTREGARQYSEAVSVTVDWLPAQPQSVQATLEDMPDRRPDRNAPQKPVHATVRAAYSFPATPGIRSFALMLGQLNAYRMTGSLRTSGGMRVLRASSGTLAADGSAVDGMESVNGSPDSFQAIFTIGPASGLSGQTARPRFSGPMVPAWAAALCGVLLFLAGRRTSGSATHAAACKSQQNPASRPHAP